MSSSESWQRGAEQSRFRCLGWSPVTEALTINGQHLIEPLLLEDPQASDVSSHGCASRTSEQLHMWRRQIQGYHDFKSIWQAQAEALWLRAGIIFPAVDVDFCDFSNRWKVKASPNLTTRLSQSSMEQSSGLGGSHVTDLWCNTLDPVFDSDGPSERYNSQIGVKTWRTIPELPEDYQTLRRERFEEENQAEAFPGNGQLVLHDPDGWTRFATAVHRNGINPVAVIFHGLLYRSIGSRRVLLPGLHLLSIEEAINNIWPEFSVLERKAFLVHPQPTLSFPDNEAVSVVVEFLDHLHEPEESIVPVLQECFRHGHLETVRVAAYCSQIFSGTQAQIDADNCPTTTESTREDVWVRNMPVRPGSNKIVEPGDLISIRVADIISTFGMFSQTFPDGYEFGHSMTELSSLCEKRPATWTFVGSTQQGTPALLDFFQPAWEALHDPHRVQHFFHSLLVHRGLQVEDYILHHVPSPLSTDATFIYGKREEEGCLIHVVWSAKWDESWREQYCHHVPSLTTPSTIFERSGLEGYECNFILNGRRVEAGSLLSLLPGSQLEIELASNASSTDNNSSQHENVQDADETSMWQVGIVSAEHCHLNNVGSWWHKERMEEINSDSGTPAFCTHYKVEDHSFSGTLPVPAVQLRPNQNIVTEFDDMVPYVYRDAQGQAIHGNIIPPPGWRDSPVYRAALNSGVAYRDGSGRLVVSFRSWIIIHNEDPVFEHRDFDVRPQLLVQLVEHAQRVWRDRIPPYFIPRVHLVRPTPMDDPADPPGTRLLHLLVEVRRPYTSHLNPMLIAARQISATGVSNPQWMPLLMPLAIDTTMVLQRTAIQCSLHHLLVPLPGRVRRWMNPYHQRDTFPGQFLPIWWDMRLRPVQPPPYPEEGDEQQFLQTVRSTTLTSIEESASIGTDDITPAVCRLQDEPSTGRLFVTSEDDIAAPRRPPQLPPRIPDDIATGTFMQNQDFLVAHGVDPQLPQEVDTWIVCAAH